MNIKELSYNAEKSGQHLVVFGAVHGNEPCGTQAIERVIAEVDAGKISLAAGKLTFVPIANPKAYQQGKRFIERNLNRYLYPKETPVLYEDFLTPILCNILKDADALLDLHSYPSLGGAFCFLGRSSPEEIDFCHALGVDHFVYGWSEAFGVSSQQEDIYESMGTTEYTRHQKGIATTIECGSHHVENSRSADNAEVGYKAILRALLHFEMITPDQEHVDEVLSGMVENTEPHYIKMRSVFYKEKPGVLVRPWRHLDRVSQGDVIARYEDGETVKVVEDGYLVLPMVDEDYPLGSEWFYFGVKTEKPTVLL